MEKKYEITIRELVPFTKEEREEAERTQRMNHSLMDGVESFSDVPHHEVRSIFAVLSEQEFEEIKKAVIKVA